MLQVDGELINAHAFELLQPTHVLLDGPQHAEAIDDLVGHERGVDVARLSVLVVVVALATLDVVGQRLGDRRGLAVAGDDVGDVVADHAAEPAALVAPVGKVVGDVGGRGDADRDVVGIASGLLGRLAHGGDRPRRHVRIGELQDEAVGHLADQLQRFGPVAGHPDLGPALRRPREANRRAPVLHLAAVRQLADHMDRFPQRGQRRRATVDHAYRGVSAADPDHGSIAEHLVQRGEQAGRDRPVAGDRVRHHRPDDDVAGLGQDLRVDRERLLPGRWLSNVHTWLNPYVSAFFARSITLALGGVVCRTTPMSMRQRATMSSYASGRRSR